jgi:hypothetical protein
MTSTFGSQAACGQSTERANHPRRVGPFRRYACCEGVSALRRLTIAYIACDGDGGRVNRIPSTFVPASHIVFVLAARIGSRARSTHSERASRQRHLRYNGESLVAGL